MPQAGIDPPVQSHASYEASALPPSHHSWMSYLFILVDFISTYTNFNEPNSSIWMVILHAEE